MHHPIKELFAQIINCEKQGLPFVAFRKPQDTTIHLFWQDTDQIHSVGKDPIFGFVMAPYRHDQAPYLISPDQYKSAVYEPDPSKDESSAPEDPITTPLAEVQHIQLVNKAIAAIKAQALEKVVLARASTFSTKKTSEAIFNGLLNSYPNAFCYLWSHPKVGVWLGATPERLMQINDKSLHTVALAGTIQKDPRQRVSNTLSKQWTSKELDEQRLVTTDIENRLSALGLVVNTSAVYEASAGNICHLKTDIHVAQTKDTPTVALIEALHPSPAICGLPRDQAEWFIKTEEGLDRSFYAGYLGVLHADLAQEVFPQTRLAPLEADLYVNLRCMQHLGDKAIVYVGSGITEDSDASAEWKETVLKAETIKKVI